MLLPALALLVAGGAAHALAGEDLYEGRVALVARLRGDDSALPPQASRCANCHEPDQRPGATAYGPRLDSESLTRPQPRRGGPPSAYDQATFCRALQDGVDPAHVLLRRAMPTYALGEGQCQALWQHLSRRPAQAAGRP